MTKPILVLCLLASITFNLNAQTPVVNARPRTGTITINGNPNETNWNLAAYGTNLSKNIVGTSNNTVRYAALWDATYLYIAVTVTDASKFNDSPSDWDDDAIEIYIDADNNGGTTYGTNDRQYIKGWNSSTISEKNSKITGVTHAWSNITGGYAVEMRIQWTAIGITNPGLGFTIGFDVASDDDDNGSARESQVMWAGDADNWQYPRNFGDLVLSPTPGTDTQVPTTPTGLASSNLTATAVTLSWTASTDNVGVTGYDVYRNGTKINTSVVTGTTYSATGLTNATAYSFYVRARDAAGNLSANSNTVSITTPDNQSPTAATNLTASSVTATGLTLNWTASTDNVAVTGYDVYQNNVKINASPVTTLSYPITGLTQGTAYMYYVKAFDAAGNFSANSNTLNVTTTDTQAPTAPSNLASSNLASTSVTLNWTASTDNLAVSGYDIYRNGVKINTAIITTLTYAATGLSASTSYSFYVQARDAAGNLSANSNTVSVITPAVVGCTGTGAINFQRWNNVTGTAVTNLTSLAAYPNSPSATGTYTSFEIPVNNSDNYGIRLYGYICPPVTGSYTFWIAADDNAELWLSTTSSPANRVRIAYHNTYTASREWNKVTTQKSAAITLTAGQIYFVEALMKEGTGGDNLAVGWAKPGQATTTPGEVIPGSSLLTQGAPDTQAPSAPTALVSNSITQNSFTLGWTASSDNVAVSGYDVYQDNVKINSSTVVGTSFNVSGLQSSTNYTYYVVAKDAAGNVSANSISLPVTTGAPDIELPSVPTGLSSSIITQTSFTMNWVAATDNVGVTGYDVYKNGVKANTATITGTSFNVTNLIPGTTYTMTVVAKDAAGNESAPANNLAVTTLLPDPGMESFTQRTVIGNQRMPHDLVWGPDNNIWYTERFGGTVSFVNPVTSVKRVVLSLGSLMVRGGGQDGLMGLALHPEFNTGKPYVYISYTYASTSSTVRKTRIARYTYNSSTQLLESPVTILEDIPGSNDHNSSRLAIGPDVKLYFTVGDMGAGQFDNVGRANNAQNLNIYEGKVLRLNTELESSSWIPADNPFTNAGTPTAVYTLGHRNPQGLVWGKVNGIDILYSSEHGPYSDDELNIIERARNYGWPQISGFCDGNYNGRTIGGFAVVSEQNNCVTLNAKEPIRSLFPAANPPTDATSNMTWPSTGVCGTEFYGSTAIPGWQNSLLVAELKKGAVARFKLSSDGMSIISDTINYFKGLGRFRDVIVSPDGLKIYVACDSSGSTSGPTGGVTTTPANPGAILEFTYQGPIGSGSREMITQASAEIAIDKSIDIYPNPASTFIVVYNYKDAIGRQIELVDLSGRMVRKQRVTNLSTRIETNGLSNGIYFLKVSDTKGKTLRLEKILVHK